VPGPAPEKRPASARKAAATALESRSTAARVKASALKKKKRDPSRSTDYGPSRPGDPTGWAFTFLYTWALQTHAARLPSAQDDRALTLDLGPASAKA